VDNLKIVKASSPHKYDANYRPDRTIDNDLNAQSRWSSKGSERSITFKLDRQSTVFGVSTAWYKANVRNAYFNVLTSVDNKHWETVLYQAAAHGTEGMIYFDVDFCIALE